MSGADADDTLDDDDRRIAARTCANLGHKIVRQGRKLNVPRLVAIGRRFSIAPTRLADFKTLRAPLDDLRAFVSRLVGPIADELRGVIERLEAMLDSVFGFATN